MCEIVFRDQNLQRKDFSDVMFVHDRCFFIERHAIAKGRWWRRYNWDISLRCPAGHKPFKIEKKFTGVQEIESIPRDSQVTHIQALATYPTRFNAPFNFLPPKVTIELTPTTKDIHPYD
jgi:hypothetical protein